MPDWEEDDGPDEWLAEIRALVRQFYRRSSLTIEEQRHLVRMTAQLDIWLCGGGSRPVDWLPPKPRRPIEDVELPPL